MYKTPQLRSTFGKLWCRKSARRCGAKCVSKSKSTQHTRVRALLEVVMSKKCTSLWREAHFKVKSVKNWRSRSTFGSWDIEKVHVIVARSTFRSQHVKSTTCSDHFWTFRCLFVWQAQGIVHLVKKREGFVAVSTTTTTALHYTPLQLQLHYITLRTLNYTTRITGHYATLHYTNYITLHYVTPHYTTTLHYTTLRYATLH